MTVTTTPTLSDVVVSVESHRKTVEVRNFTGSDTELAAISEFFDPHDVDVEVEDGEGPDDVVVLRSRTTELARSPVERVTRYVRSWQESMSTGLAAEPPAVVDRLHDNFFESYDKGRMVMASRIVEFRAWNSGSGELHAGFQQLSKLEHQRNAYRNLSESDVAIHVYGATDGARLDDLDVAVHRSTADEVLNHWWVAFDGAGDDDKVVLLAQEREPDRFYGFWTYEAAVVDDVLERMADLA